MSLKPADTYCKKCVWSSKVSDMSDTKKKMLKQKGEDRKAIAQAQYLCPFSGCIYD